MTDPYHDQIKGLITRNGAMGVNALQREIGIPLSTLQKYLERQTYFKKTEQRKWDLPEKVAQVQTSEGISNYEAVIESQLTGITAMFDMLTNQIKSTLTLLSAQKHITPPVAGILGKSTKIDPRLDTINEHAEKMIDVFKKQKHNIPEECQNLLFNFDYVGLVLKDGRNYANEWLESEIYDLLAGKVKELSEESLQILKENQKGQE